MRHLWGMVPVVLAGVLLASLVGISVATAAPACPIPRFDVRVSPGDNIDAVAQRAPEGAVIYLSAGTYRFQSIRPRKGQSFVGARDPVSCARLAVLDGSIRLTHFHREGRFYVIGGQWRRGRVLGICMRSRPTCKYSDDVFLDSHVLRHVGSRAKVASGSYYFDYADGKIYLADDPAGQKLERSIIPVAFEPSADDVTIRNLVIEKYATPAHIGTIGGAKRRTGWIVQNNEIRLNHGEGVDVGSGSMIIGNVIDHNGQLGVIGAGRRILVADNVISYNNTAGFSRGWECGGMKVVLSDHLVVRDNIVRHNFGPGLWTDISNIDTLYEGNIVEDNEGEGIKHEISYRVIITRNVVRRNAPNDNIWASGAQIELQNSRDGLIDRNLVEVAPTGGHGIVIVHQERGKGPYGAWEARDNLVTENEIIYGGAKGVSGLFADTERRKILSWDNRFRDNIYVMHDSGGRHWHWLHQVTFQEFNAFNGGKAGVITKRN